MSENCAQLMKDTFLTVPSPRLKVRGWSCVKYFVLCLNYKKKKS